MKTGITSLGQVLGDVVRFDPGHFLYLPMNEIWQLETNCAVLAQSDLDGVPEMAKKNELSYAIGISEVMDIIVNARQQAEEVSLDQLLEAFLFYYDHDAFVTFGE